MDGDLNERNGDGGIGAIDQPDEQVGRDEMNGIEEGGDDDIVDDDSSYNSSDDDIPDPDLIRRQLERDDPDLTELDIGHHLDGIYDLFDGANIGRSTHLKTLVISDGISSYGQNLTAEDYGEYFRGVANNRSIQELEIQDWGFDTPLGGKIFDVLATFLHGNPNLQKLTINDCEAKWGLESEKFRCLLAALSKPSSLREFASSSTLLSDEEIVALIPILSRHHQLENFEVSMYAETMGHRGIGVGACDTIANWLRNPICTLTKLILSDSLGLRELTTLVDGLKDNDTLKELDLSHNFLMPAEGWQVLCTLWSNSKTAVENLCIRDCDIRDEGAEILAEGLADNRQLKMLDLSVNRIAIRGLRAISNILQNPRSVLEELNLYENRDLRNDGAIVLANSLTNNKTLKKLNLPLHQIDDTGWSVFSRVLCTTSGIFQTFNSNHSLEVIDEGFSGSDPPEFSSDLHLYLGLNKSANKADVARQKIKKIHFSGDFSMHPFNDMKVGVLPQAIAWMGKDCSDAHEAGGSYFSSFYRFVKTMPSFFDFNGDSRGKKRSNCKRQKLA